MLPIPPQFGDTSSNVIERSMIPAFTLGPQLLSLTVPNLPLSFLPGIPTFDQFLYATNVDDAVVQMGDELGHFFDQKHFICVDCVAGKAGGVGGWDSITYICQDGCADGGVWKRKVGGETG